MATVAAQLTALESKLTTAEGDREAAAMTIETSRQTLRQSEQDLQKLTLEANALQDRVEATKRVASAAEEAEKNMAAGREGGAADIATTKNEIKDWDKAIADAVPAATLKKLPKALKKIDDAIADKQKKADDA